MRPKRVLTIHNGIDPEHFRRRLSRDQARRTLNLPIDDRLMIGGVGRLDSVKGFEYILPAIKMLTASYPNLMLVLAGDGPQRALLENQVTWLGITSNVRFLGFCTDVQCVLDALDIFVMSSLSEALPYALLEAMAAELPTVATTVGGIPEVVAFGETGFLARPRDPTALTTALRPLLDSADLRRRFGAAGRERVVRHFNEADMVGRTIDVYRQILRTPLARA